MKVLLHRLDGGASFLEEAPVPAARGPRVLIETRATVVSAGTERMLVEFGRANMISKVRQQPEKVRQVLDKARTDGIAVTLEAVQSKLAEPMALGYCHAGVVVERGAATVPFEPGTRVVSNGAHAEYVSIPHTLVARIPDSVPFDVAAFTPLAAIGLQGVRLAAPTLGETVVVYGLGLIGLLTVQLLRASGCRVIGIDTNTDRLRLAERFGAVALDANATDVVAAVMARTAGVGADAVLLTLATSSDEPAHLAAQMSRKRGRLVLVGVTGLNLRRDDFYRKELSFAVSCSYGPGRYDASYEDGGQDYPLPFVRWTEQRNFEAVLAMMADGSVDPRPLMSHRFAFDDSPSAYDVLTGGAPSLGIVLEYPDRGAAPITPQDRIRELRAAPAVKGACSAGVIGAGAFGKRILIPALKAAGARLRSVASTQGTNAAIAARALGFERSVSDVDHVFSDPEVDTVVVLTRHDSHGSFALRGLRAGKHVFVEKPLALSLTELDEIEAAVRAGRTILTVGFNRRFAPLARALKQELSRRTGPVALVLTVNAGNLPKDHWTQDPVSGGGRIVGEACHFIDLARALAGSPLRDVNVVAARDASGRPIDDVAHIVMSFEDGSTAVVHYLSNGSAAFPKERIEAFADGRIWQIDNWRRLRAWGGGTAVGNVLSKQAKGHREELQQFADAVRTGGQPPIPYDELFEVSRWSIKAAEAARSTTGR